MKKKTPRIGCYHKGCTLGHCMQKEAAKATQQPDECIALSPCHVCGRIAMKSTPDQYGLFNVQCSDITCIGADSWVTERYWNSRHTPKRESTPPVDCRGFDEWCESVKDCGHTVQPNSATARQRRLGWDAAMSTKRESGDYLPSHASTGLDSFVTRLEKALRTRRPGQHVSVNSRDLHTILYHFIRLDNAARDEQGRRG